MTPYKLNKVNVDSVVYSPFVHLRLLYAGHTLCGSWVATDDEELFTFGRTVTCLNCLVVQQQIEGEQ